MFAKELLEKILIDLSGKLRDKYGIEPEVNYQGSIILRGVATPTSPIIPEEVAQLIKETVEANGATFNFTDWPSGVNKDNGNLTIRYTPTS